MKQAVGASMMPGGRWFWAVVLGIGVIVVVVWRLTPCVVWWFLPPAEVPVSADAAATAAVPALERRGQVGDQFNVVNSLFTGLGIAFLSANVWLQRVQIQDEAKKSREQADEIQQRQYQLQAQLLINQLSGKGPGLGIEKLKTERIEQRRLLGPEQVNDQEKKAPWKDRVVQLQKRYATQLDAQAIADAATLWWTAVHYISGCREPNRGILLRLLSRSVSYLDRDVLLFHLVTLGDDAQELAMAKELPVFGDVVTTQLPASLRYDWPHFVEVVTNHQLSPSVTP